MTILYMSCEFKQTVIISNRTNDFFSYQNIFYIIFRLYSRCIYTSSLDYSFFILGISAIESLIRSTKTPINNIALLLSIISNRTFHSLINHIIQFICC
ncbi:hypothetical protein AO073_01695 [Pseudomonas syringae ICMP 11293]|nr:hypothetical protein AO073_01695 [Pseudomonas syringae ICMP 11293]